MTQVTSKELHPFRIRCGTMPRLLDRLDWMPPSGSPPTPSITGSTTSPSSAESDAL
jgi:hypothetical protein